MTARLASGAGPADVTVVLETENHHSGLRLGFPESLAGIAEQTRRDRILEVLVVAAKPPDEEQAAAIAAAGLPLVWIERPGVRYYDLKNVGIERSRGRWVVLLDSDTRMAPDYLACALEAFEAADPSVAALTGRTRYLPGPFSRELAIAQLPNQAIEPGETTHFLAHNVMFRGETVRANLFRAGHIRLFPDADLAERLLAQGLRILYRPDLAVLHNYARHWSEIGPHCVVIGYHAARHGSLDGKKIVSAPRDAAGRFRVLLRRFGRLRSEFPIPPARVPISLAFFAFYAAAVGVGYAAYRRGRPEPFALF
jgi:glycosyltransferase involved in cell wall biosynthesis